MSDLLSQDEIDALLNGISSENENNTNLSTLESEQAVSPANITEKIETADDGEDLTPEDVDVLGEIGNISMGAAATALSEILKNMVNITTPKVEVLRWEDLIQMYPRPFVATKVRFTMGILGTNLLIMKVEDVKVLTNLMMGEDPQQDRDLTELELSAIGEAMNQMVGSSCTSLSSMITKKIDITPPESNFIDLSTGNIGDLTNFSDFKGEGRIVKVAFRMVVGNLLDSELMQLLPISFAKDLVKSVLGSQLDVESAMKAEIAAKEAAKDTPQAAPAQPVQPQPQMQQPIYEQPIQQPQMQQPMYQQPIQYPNNENMNMAFQMAMQKEPQYREPINVQPVQFQSLEDAHYANYKENINLIMDVPLQVTVELGRASRMIREILEFGPGSIVELDKLAGEPVDILVNGKIIAKGEVVVIDESFGVRITDIVHPSKRL